MTTQVSGHTDFSLVFLRSDNCYKLFYNIDMPVMICV